MLSDHGHEVVGEVEDAGALVQLVDRESPELVVLDVRMPPTHTDEGIRAALELRSRGVEPAILVLSQYVEENYATELLSGDLRGIGYILKDRVTNVGEFLETVDRIGAGGTAIDPEVVSQLLARTRRQQPLGDLSPREREVLGLVAQGCSNREIAEALFLSPHTVKEYTSGVYRKLGVRNRAEAVKRAQSLGLIG